MHRLAILGALIVYAAAVVGAATSRPAAPRLPLSAAAPAATTPPAPTARPAATAPPAASASLPAVAWPRPVVGFAISLHWTDHIDAYLQAVDDLAAVGVNSLEIVTPAFQRDGAAEQITVERGKSVNREDLVKLLRHARARGLATALMPIVLFSEPRGNEWRGKVQPDNWDNWWASYRAFLDHFLDIANEAQVEAFSVGSELLSTEKPPHAERWRELIAHARSRFPGRLYYSTNWDHYHVPAFWKQLDMIGICCYWDMTTFEPKREVPSDLGLRKRWLEIRGQVMEFARAQGKPLLLTELGYPSLPWGLRDPWNYVSSSDVKATHHVQAAGYRAFLASWQDLLRPPAPGATGSAGSQQAIGDPADFAGVFFYSWEPWGDGGDDDIGYGVRGKPALDVLRQWLRPQR